MNCNVLVIQYSFPTIHTFDVNSNFISAPQRGISSDLISLSFTDLTQQMNSSRWNYNQLSQYQKASSVSGKISLLALSHSHSLS